MIWSRVHDMERRDGVNVTSISIGMQGGEQIDIYGHQMTTLPNERRRNRRTSLGGYLSVQGVSLNGLRPYEDPPDDDDREGYNRIGNRIRFVPVGNTPSSQRCDKCGNVGHKGKQ